MSEGGEQPEQGGSNNNRFEAIYSNGQMEIVSVFHTDDNQQAASNPPALNSMYPESSDDAEKCFKLDPQSLDMFNFTLIKYDEDSEGTYRLVTNGDGTVACCDDEDDDDNTETVTCVLQSDDENGSVLTSLTSNNETFVMMKSENGETMYLRAAVQTPNEVCTENNAGQSKNNAGENKNNAGENSNHAGENKNNAGQNKNSSGEGKNDAEGNEIVAGIEKDTKSEEKKPSLEEILSKHKIVKKVHQQISKPIAYHQRGRKRKSEMPPIKELLSTPTLKLYLYNCKHCPFKCNSTKELNAHRAQLHSNTYKPRSRALSKTYHNIDLYTCPACRYKTNVQSMLKQHIADKHKTKIDDDVVIFVNGVELADSEKTYLQIEKDV